jgi:hypothetical protein
VFLWLWKSPKSSEHGLINDNVKKNWGVRIGLAGTIRVGWDHKALNKSSIALCSIVKDASSSSAY